MKPLIVMTLALLALLMPAYAGPGIDQYLCKSVAEEYLRNICAADWENVIHQGQHPTAGEYGIVDYSSRLFVIGNRQFDVRVIKGSASTPKIMFDNNANKVVRAKPGETRVLQDGTNVKYISADPPFVFIQIIPSEKAQLKPPRQPLVVLDNLNLYPRFFAKNNKIDANIVLGDSAPASDVVAAADIMNALQKKYPKTALGIAKLASEVTEIGNMIAIGSPCDNPVVARITGISDCHFNLNKGEAAIRLYNLNGKKQIVVVGYSPAETRVAARALANWKGLQGTKFKVTGTLNKIHVFPAN